MIDPPDTLIDVYRQGNDGVLPTPTGGEWGQQPTTDYESPRKVQPPMFFTQFITLTNPGDFAHINAPGQPEYWTVNGCTSTTVNPTAEAQAWAADDRAGQPEIIISGTGKGRIPGVYQRLFVVNTGTGAIRLLIRATVGYDFAENSY